MPEQKQEVKKVVLANKAKYIAKKGCNQPLKYKGKFIHIGDKEAVELELEHLAYETKLELKRAIKLGNVLVK